MATLQPMADNRPDPDALLARVQRDEVKSKRGKLKIFLGASAGVGKTYAMLSDGREEKARGTDIVIGIVETHGRAETAALTEGIEHVPLRTVSYKETTLREFDLDAALARKPGVILVDELAHTNAPGSRHPKRWQDVQELLAAGIDVCTTLNVQHLESLNDVVGQITGIRVFETLPDKVFDEADEVELVDLPPDELIERLHEGKVYLPEQALRAADNFFRKGNLIALRELALRRTADRVDEQMRDYRTGAGIRVSWPAADRVLVTVGPGSDAENLVRAARRLASALDAEWTALYVETPALQRLPEADRDRILGALRLAESLGGKSVVVGGGDVATAVLEYARAQNISRILVGRPHRRGWRKWVVGSTADRIVAGAPDLDVAVIGAEARPTAVAAAMIVRTRDALDIVRPAKRRWHRYAVAAAVPIVLTALGSLIHGKLELSNIIMLYLLGVVPIAIYFGRGPSILASVLSVATFDFFFVPPYLTFAVSDVEYLVTFGVMLLVGFTISNLAARVRLQARIAGYREERASALYEMSGALAATEKLEDIVGIAVKHLHEVFASQVVVLLPDATSRVRYPRAESVFGSLHGADLSIAQWVYDHAQAAGLGTDTLAGADVLFLPLVTPNKTIGVVALLPANPRRVFVPEQRRLLDTFTGQVAVAIERAQVAEAARASELRARTEGVRNALLSAISHELRTPLATIVGASTSLAEAPETMSDAARRELARSVAEEAQRMSDIVVKVLDLARLQAGATRVQADWHPVEEVIGSALSRMGPKLARHRVTTHLPAKSRLARLDAVLIEQVLTNLFENATKYTPPGTNINVSAEFSRGELAITVTDDGPGLPPGEESKIFDKFHRVAPETVPGGAGLGLAICKAIVEAHGGTIYAENIPAGGSLFRFTLPQEENPPSIPREIEEHAA
jgi:two-component system sensor histidine kinase KdpD